MTQFKGILAIAAIIVVPAVALAQTDPTLPPPPPPISVYLVDDSDAIADTNGCGTKANPCNTIQAAVALTKPNDIVRVSPGTYTGTITITKSLMLRGAQWGEDARERTNPVNEESVVTGTINIQADKVTVRGFTIKGVSAQAISTGSGFSGHTLRENIIEDNVFGLYLLGNGVNRTMIEENYFKNNNRAGGGTGNGILSNTVLSNTIIDENKFTGHNNGSIVLSGSNITGVTVSENEMTDDAAIILGNVKNSRILKNTMLRPKTTAIFLSGGVDGVTIKGNTLQNGAFRGIRILQNAGAAVNKNLLVKSNMITGFKHATLGIGIQVEIMEDSTVEKNTLQNNTVGLSVSGGTDNQYEDNTASGSTNNDIVDTTSSPDSFENNTCTKSSPTGLCS